MSHNLIKALINTLPRFAEEDGDYYRVSRDDIVRKLCEIPGISPEVAGNTVDLCEALLDSLATLKADDLQRGEWCFVSFPAQLLAMSVLTAMSDPESRYFETDFWNTRDVDSSQKERQREVLKAAENRRNDRHLTHNAVPVRFIHVAWSLIKLEGKVLFYHREDKTRHEDKSGNYGLPGGRVNQKDLGHLDGDMTEKLRILQSADRERLKPALVETLKRELLEETGLAYEQHYFFKPWRTLKPYRQVQGAASNHALTEYYLDIFAIELTLEGFCFLHQKIAEDEGLVWFSLDEVVQGKTRDGSKTAYIEALYKDFNNDGIGLKKALEELGDSFSANYANCKEKYRIVLPRDAGQKVCAGVAGKEAALDITLNQEQLSLLLGLAAHLRSFGFTEDPTIIRHPYGWIEVKNGCELQAELIKLAEALKDSKDIMVENQKDRWFRLSASPNQLFFDDSFFWCSVDQRDLKSTKSKIPVTIIRRNIDTRLGAAHEDRREVMVSLLLAGELIKLKTNSLSLAADSSAADYDKAVKIRDNHNKALRPHCLEMGMRGVLRQDAMLLKACCEFVIVGM